MNLTFLFLIAFGHSFFMTTFTWQLGSVLLSYHLGRPMHELAVTESILKIALEHAEKARAGRITDLYIVVGQLSSIVDDSVQFYWNMVSDGTAAQGASLHFRRVPTELLCLDCSTRYTPTHDDLACPKCGGIHVKVVAGEEFYLEAIDVEDGRRTTSDGRRTTTDEQAAVDDL